METNRLTLLLHESIVEQMKPKMGRPPKPKSEKQVFRVTVNMTRQEYRKLEQQAKAAGMTLTALLLEVWRRTQ